ncbi:hypothetical protein SDC9_139785 [bioreactor metagenome]|uniref:Uncharacterized protein n=1 Tax=bioreactor metagenome TaxID=1076179 RepID=A0A645DT31_9ZZZZ
MINAVKFRHRIGDFEGHILEPGRSGRLRRTRRGLKRNLNRLDSGDAVLRRKFEMQRRPLGIGRARSACNLQTFSRGVEQKHMNLDAAAGQIAGVFNLGRKTVVPGRVHRNGSGNQVGTAALAVIGQFDRAGFVLIERRRHAVPADFIGFESKVEPGLEIGAEIEFLELGRAGGVGRPRRGLERDLNLSGALRPVGRLDVEPGLGPAGLSHAGSADRPDAFAGRVQNEQMQLAAAGHIARGFDQRAQCVGLGRIDRNRFAGNQIRPGLLALVNQLQDAGASTVFAMPTQPIAGSANFSSPPVAGAIASASKAPNQNIFFPITRTFFV